MSFLNFNATFFFVVDCILTSLKLIFHSHFHSQWSEGSHKHNIDILPKFWPLSVWECEIHHDCVTRYDSCSHKKAVMMRSFKRWLHGHFVKRSLVEAWAHMYAQLILYSVMFLQVSPELCHSKLVPGALATFTAYARLFLDAFPAPRDPKSADFLSFFPWVLSFIFSFEFFL